MNIIDAIFVYITKKDYLIIVEAFTLLQTEKNKLKRKLKSA